jgi:hypothetical protein
MLELSNGFKTNLPIMPSKKITSTGGIAFFLEIPKKCT